MAGCFDSSSWRVGSKARGTRSQFKLATEGLLPFKCTYPVHLTDVMDGNLSPHSDPRRGELSPIRGTHTLGVREYEETIQELRKENFDLKLKRFLLEEHINKIHRKKGSEADDYDVQVIVELQVQTETLKRELNNKDQALQDQAKQHESDLRELRGKCIELQEQLSSTANIPLENERLLLKDEKEHFEKQTENLRHELSKNDQLIQKMNAEIMELHNKNQALESKAKKSSLAIQGLVSRYYTDVEVPKEVRPIVQEAVKAAKECKEEELNTAIGEFNATLFQIMSKHKLSQEQKENKDPSGSKTSFSKPLNLSKASVSVRESSLSSTKTKFVNIKEQTPTKVKILSQSSESNLSVGSEGSEDFEEMVNVLKNLNEEKERTIQDLNGTYNELERRTIQLQSELLEAVSKIKKLEMKTREEKSKSTSSLPKENSSVQTSVQCHLMQSKLCDSFLQSVGQSDSVDELKEEILRLLLIIEQKDKEVSDIEQELGSLQSHLERIENQKTNSFSHLHKDINDMVERSDLHRRLALSSEINHELMAHLRKLESFMEDLLQHKNFDSSSMGSLSEASSLLSHLTACLDETKKLSDDLSDHLSVCENSKLFEPSEISMTGEEQEALRPAFICKKCSSQSPSKEECLQKVVNELSNKCSKQENQLDKLRETLDHKIIEIDTLNKDKLELTNCTQQLEKDIHKFKIKSQELTLESSESTSRLVEVSSENDKLRISMEKLEAKATESEVICKNLKDELEQTKSRLENLDRNCSKYVKDLSSSTKSLEEYKEKYNNVEKEKDKLSKNIQELVSTKNELLQSIQLQKDKIQLFENQKYELKGKLEKQTKSLASLQSHYEEFKTESEELLKEKEDNLLCSKSMCEEVKEKLKKAQESFENLKQLCTTYENDSQQSLEVKETLIGFLLKVKNLFLCNLQNLTDVCQQYLDCEEEENFKDIDNILSGKLSTTDKNVQMKELFNDIITINTKLEQEIEFLSDQLSSLSSIQQQFKMNNKEIQSLEKQNSQLNNHIQTLQATENESKSLIKESKSKIDFLQQDLSNAQTDIKTLKEQAKEQQIHIEGLEQSLKDREKSIENSKAMLSSSEMKLNSLQKQAEKDKRDLNKLKNEECSKLQDECLRVKSKLLEVLQEQAAVVHQTRLTSSQLDQESVSTIGPSKGCLNASESSISPEVTNKWDSTENITSAKGEESNKNNDQYVKKIKSLKAKLAITEKRCEMLQKEKSDLRAGLLAQVQGERTANQVSEENDGLRKDLTNLKEKLEAKSSFIKDLKRDMYKTCNDLVDKQKEVDNLKRKLSDSKEEIKYETVDSLKARYSDPLHTDTEANIKMLKKQKWEFIQSILDQQKQFYERKNIHLGHWDKFKKHIEELHSIQVYPKMFRSESTPLLNLVTAENNCYAEKCDNTLKNFRIELELDVQCLQNFKIFFQRFFIPLVLKSCEQCSTNFDSSPKHSFNENDKSVSSPGRILTESKSCANDPLLENFRTSSAEVAHHRRSEHSFNDRLISTASALAHKIDVMESILKSVKPLLENFKESSSVKETPKKNATMSLLEKLSVEINTLQEKADKIFHLNFVLKSLGLFDATLSQSRSKQDISDRESLSEETITISRSGSLSPMSFEDNLPFQSFSNNSERDKSAAGKENYAKLSHKSNVAGGSQESIIQRSHFSSPDLGIESDPNHESSAPEQAEKEELRRSTSRRHESGLGEVWSIEKQARVSVRSVVDSCSPKSKVSDHANASGDSLHAICTLPHYELLKKEVQESLVGIKSLLSRTNDGLQHVSKFTSPRKNLECTTFKAIRDTSENIKVCLEEARKLVDKFWVSPCPSAQELTALLQQQHEDQEKLKRLHESKIKQETYFKEAMAKLKNAEHAQEKIEKKISKKLVKTKKVIRQAESKLLEQGSQDLPKIPKYPME